MLTAPRILIFYADRCPDCRILFGAKRKAKTALIKALQIIENAGFVVIWLDVDEPSTLNQLRAITCRHPTFIPYIVTPFAVLESPPHNATVGDYISAMLGEKKLPTFGTWSKE